MQRTGRSVTLFLWGVAAASFFVGCATSDGPPAETAEVTEVGRDAPPDLVEKPTPEEAEAVSPGLRELEEELEARQEQETHRNARSLKEQAERFEATVEKGNADKEWVVKKGSRSLALLENSREAVVDGVKVFLDTPLSQKKGKWILGDSDERIILQSLFGNQAKRTERIETIVLDPGHGGTEDGTKNEALGLFEKEMNLDVSLRLQGHLEAMGFKVVLTRYDDRLVDLKERPKIAKSVDADLFVSVHFNAAMNPTPKGLETYMLTPPGKVSTADSTVAPEEALPMPGNAFESESYALAYRIQKSMINRLKREDRGVKKARFAVLKTLDCPGVLVECGFLSNPGEAQLIGTAGYRERVAQALADAIKEYADAVAPSDS